MEVVRQAHLPGNYELCDEEGGVLGASICKMCWEKAGIRNVAALDTVWLSVDGWEVIWWLCKGHRQEVEAGGPSMHVMKSESRLVRSPTVGKRS